MPIPRPVVIRSVALLKELSKAYGSAKAMEIWEALSNLVDDGDLKMEVFKVMLTGGNTGDTFELRRWFNSGNTKITAIKALRAWTHCGLKEGKESVEAAEYGTVTIFKIRKQYIGGTNEETEIDYNRFLREMEAADLSVELV